MQDRHLADFMQHIFSVSFIFTVNLC